MPFFACACVSGFRAQGPQLFLCVIVLYLAVRRFFSRQCSWEAVAESVACISPIQTDLHPHQAVGTQLRRCKSWVIRCCPVTQPQVAAAARWAGAAYPPESLPPAGSGGAHSPPPPIPPASLSPPAPRSPLLRLPESAAGPRSHIPPPGGDDAAGGDAAAARVTGRPRPARPNPSPPAAAAAAADGRPNPSPAATVDTVARRAAPMLPPLEASGPDGSADSPSAVARTARAG